MLEFNSLNDWSRVDQELRRALRALHDDGSKRQLSKMRDNLYQSITELSKAEIEVRRTSCGPTSSKLYLEKLTKCRQELQEVQQWLVFATLIDKKPEE
jgi:hypothetical protein